MAALLRSGKRLPDPAKIRRQNGSAIRADQRIDMDVDRLGDAARSFRPYLPPSRGAGQALTLAMVCLLMGTPSLALGEPKDQDPEAAPHPGGPAQPDSGDFDHRAWTIEEGLPQNTITSMVQTRDGYLWLGTFGGLARFDGIRFTVFDVANTEALGTNRILSLLEDRRGNLWIGTQGRGVVRLRDGVFTSSRGQQGAPVGSTGSIVEDDEGGIWFGGDNLVRYADGAFDAFEPDDWKGKAWRVQSLRIDCQSNLWVASAVGLARFGDGQWKVFTQADGLPGNDVRFVDEGPEGTMWASTGQWIACLDRGRFVHTPEQGDRPISVYAAAVDRRGGYWIASGSGLFRAGEASGAKDGSRVGLWFERVAPRSITGSGGVRSVLEDREGSIWVGTNGHGLLRLQKRRFRSLALPPNVRHKLPESLAADDSGGLWIGLSGKYSVRWQDDEWVETPPPSEIDRIDTMATGRDGSLWIAHEAGWLSKLRNGQFVHYQHGLGRVGAILDSRQAGLWLATENGLSMFRDEKIDTVAVNSELTPRGKFGCSPNHPTEPCGG